MHDDVNNVLDELHDSWLVEGGQNEDLDEHNAEAIAQSRPTTITIGQITKGKKTGKSMRAQLPMLHVSTGVAPG